MQTLPDMTRWNWNELKASGLRVVYRLIRTETEMLIVVIGARAEDEVYKIAAKRYRKDFMERAGE